MEDTLARVLKFRRRNPELLAYHFVLKALKWGEDCGRLIAVLEATVVSGSSPFSLNLGV